MSKPTITETVYAGNQLATGRVELSLVAADGSDSWGYATGSNLSFLGTRSIELVDGVWSVVLNPNVGTSTDVITYPNGSTGTRWKVVTRLASMHGPNAHTVRYLKVPDQSGTLQAQDIVVPAPKPPRLVAADDFSGYTDGQIITDNTYYTGGTFPHNGGADPDNPSALWETGNGGLYGDSDGTSMWGYSGTPLAAGTTNHFRATFRNWTVKHQRVRFKYKSAAYGVDGYAVAGFEAVDVWLRYITEFNLYALQFDRVDGRIYLKRKVPADVFASNPTWISNSGIYYGIPTDSLQPVFGAGSPYATYTGQSLSPPQHNATSVSGAIYQIEATIDTIGWASGIPIVQVQLFRDGILVGSFTDTNNGLAPSGGLTLADDITAGNFSAVTGYQSTWYAPINSHGGTGVRSDNVKTWIKDFEFWDLDG